jgi:hypothetical protein
MSNIGVDPTLYYTTTTTVGASVTPELPGPPFQVGTRAIGSDGSEFIFVQASTSISLTDFVAINIAQAAAPYQANSVNTTNIFGSLLVGMGSSGLVLKQSVTFIPAGAFFWACTKGQFIPATTSGGVLATTSNSAGVGAVALYVALTGVGTGILTSVSTTLSPGIAGIVCVNSLTVSIPSSIIPAGLGGTTSNGFTVGPVVAINNPRQIIVGTTVSPVSANAATNTGAGFAF